MTRKYNLFQDALAAIKAVEGMDRLGPGDNTKIMKDMEASRRKREAYDSDLREMLEIARQKHEAQIRDTEAKRAALRREWLTDQALRWDQPKTKMTEPEFSLEEMERAEEVIRNL